MIITCHSFCSTIKIEYVYFYGLYVVLKRVCACVSVLLAGFDDKGEHSTLLSNANFIKLNVCQHRSASVVHDFIVDIPHE